MLSKLRSLLECKDLSERIQSLMTYAGNIVLPFSDRGMETARSELASSHIQTSRH
jgi:hypothetical protein